MLFYPRNILIVVILVVCIPLPVPAQCWMYQTSGTNYNLRLVSFADSLHGIMFGSDFIPFRTTDGGANWIAQAPFFYNKICDVIMTDSATAYAVGAERSIFKSTNGGISWFLQRGNETGTLTAISFYDKNRGIAVGSQGLIYYTTDAGQWWYRASITEQLDLADISWIDTMTAITAGALVYKTVDGGISWTRITGVLSMVSAISFCSPNVGVIVGWHRIYRTTNAGVDWSLQMHVDGIYFNDVSFFNDIQGLAVGSNGTIFATTDSGITWEAQASPPISYNSLCFSRNGSCHIVGDVGTVLKSIDECSNYGLRIITPTDGVGNLPLEQDDNQRSVLLKWDFIPNIRIEYIGIKISSESHLTADVIVDTNLFTLQRPVFSFAVSDLHPNTTYYWQVDLKTSDSLIQSQTDVVKFTTAGGILSGRVFNDLNRNGLREPDEYSIKRTLYVTGKIVATIHTSDSGIYSMPGIDAGTYVISDTGYSIWKHSIPESGSYTVQLGLNETVDGINFGCYFPWNSINGIVFHDLNQNGIREDSEPGLTNWPVQFKGPLGEESSITNSEGYYVFSHVPIGECTVKVNVQSGWEQIYPRVGKPLAVTLCDYDNTLISDFGIQKIPSRVKISLLYNDNRGTPVVRLFWGVHPNSGLGIWGVDEECKNADYAEGEFEIPPLFPGGFDARFVKPPFSSARYGYGSWTDMRPFISPSQIDTYYISFSAGIIDGGNYPVTFRWAKELVQSSYGGDVELAYSLSDPVDMKINDSIVIADSDVFVLRMIAEYPLLQFRWRMVSVPMEVDDMRKAVLFTNAITPAYTFEGIYSEKETLRNGAGYWLKCDSLEIFQSVGNILLQDTFDVAEGWNMIGSISVPVDVHSITSIPPAMITSEFFGHEVQYVLVDTINPAKGYWLKADQAGQIILSGNSEMMTIAEKIRIVHTSELPPPPPLDEQKELQIATIPSDFKLFQNIPNPFNAFTSICFTLPYPCKVQLKIYNILGQEISKPTDGLYPSGTSIIRWDASGVPSGIYFYRIVVGNFIETKKMVLIR